MAAQLNGKGNVVFISNPGQPNLDERLKGYKEIFAAYPGIKVVDVFDMHGDSGRAMDKAGEYLARTGADRVDAIVCLESASAKDVGEVFKRKNVKDRLLIAMDLAVGTLLLVKDGTIDSTISQKPYTMGLLGLKALDEIHHSKMKSSREIMGWIRFLRFRRSSIQGFRWWTRAMSIRCWSGPGLLNCSRARFNDDAFVLLDLGTPLPLYLRKVFERL